MPFALPFIHSPEEAEKVKNPHLEDTSLMQLFEIADELKRRGGPDALLKLPDMQSPMDIVAQIWDKTNLFPNMIEEPEVVKELAHKIKNLLMEFCDEWFQRYGAEYIAHHPDFYMQGGITMSLDEIGTIGAGMYHDFFEDEVNEMSLRYGGIGVRCCADSQHQWENLRNIPNLRLLNLYRPERVLEESYQYFSDITTMWPLTMEGNTPDFIKNMEKTEYAKGSRIVLMEEAESREDAFRLAEMLQKEYW